MVHVSAGAFDRVCERASMVGAIDFSTLDSDTHGRRQGDKACRVAYPLVPALDRLGPYV